VLGLLPDRQVSRTVRAAADIESDGNGDVRGRSGSGELNRLGEAQKWIDASFSVRWRGFAISVRR
jgi:hypothetical protein